MLFLEDNSPGRVETAVKSLAFTPDQRFLVAASNYRREGDLSWTGEVVLWNLMTGAKDAILWSGKGTASAVAVSSGNRLAANCGGTIRTWNLDAGSQGQVQARTRNRGPLSWSPDGMWLISLSEDGNLTLWATYTRENEAIIKSRYVGSAAFAPDGRLVCGDGRIVDFETGKGGEWHDQLMVMYPFVIGFSSDGRSMVRIGNLVESMQQRMAVNTFPSMECRFTLDGDFRTAALSPAGDRLLCGGKRGLGLWDVASGKRLDIPDIGPLLCFAVAFSPDGTTAAAAGIGGHSLVVWDLM